MEIIGPLLISSIAGLSTVLGSLVVYLKIKKIDEFITFCLSFSLSVMIAISILELIPISSFDIVNNYGYLKGIIICLALFIIGVLCITIINKEIDKRIKSVNQSKSLYRVGVLSMLALMIHNFPEGIATFMSAYTDLSLGISLSIAIMMHNIPEGISIAVPLYYSTGSRKRGVLLTFISGIAEPIGAILAYIFLKDYISDVLISIVLLIVAGIMITLAINEILPEAIKYNKPKYLNIGIILGSILVLTNHLISILFT